MDEQLLLQHQISHHLTGQPDDQLWYAFAKKGNQVEPSDASKMIVRREDGGISKCLGDVADLTKLAKGFVASAVTTFLQFLNDHDSIFRRDEGWERAAESLIVAIAAQANIPSAAGISTLELFEHNGLKGKRADVPTKKDVADTKTIQMNDNISSLR